jgi:hypothetical protein
MMGSTNTCGWRKVRVINILQMQQNKQVLLVGALVSCTTQQGSKGILFVFTQTSFSAWSFIAVNGVTSFEKSFPTSH